MRPRSRPRKRVCEGSSRCSRTSMNTCGGRLAGQRERRLRGGSRKRASVVFSGGRHPGLGKIGGIDVRPEGTGSIGVTRVASAPCVRAANEGCQRVHATERSPAEKAAALDPRRSARARRWQSRSPKPAARRQARGCRRPDDREVVRRRARCGETRREDLEVERWRVSPRRSADSLRRCQSRRVLVTRNVGCRSGVRGILTPLPRRAARPHEGETSSDGRDCRPGRGRTAILLAARVLRVCGGRKARACPSVAVRQDCLAHHRAQSRTRGRRVGSRLSGANPVRKVRVPGSAAHAGQSGDCHANLRRDSTRPRLCLFVRSPSRWAQGAPGLRASRKRIPCHTKGRCLGCKGEKPWHLPPEGVRANGRSAKRSRRQSKMPHDAASACGGRKRSNTP
jgi:hypothetical protein